jgi:hypothetical protein
MFADGALKNLGARRHQAPPPLNDEFLGRAAFSTNAPDIFYPADACIEAGLSEWHMPVGLRRDAVSLGHVEAGTGRSAMQYGTCEGMPPGIFLQPPESLNTQFGHHVASGTQPPPPPALPPRLSADFFVEPPPAPAHQPESCETEADVAGGRAMIASDAASRKANRFCRGSGALMAQDLAQQLNAEIVRSELKVKNTFIDSGMTRSPSLERLLQESRQVRSCPGSALPTPQGKYAGTKLGLMDIEAVSSSRASTVDTSETQESLLEDSCEQDVYAALQAMPSLQAAAWRSQARNARAGIDKVRDAKGPQLQLERALATDAQKQGRKARVLQLEHVLTFSEDSVESDDSVDGSIAVKNEDFTLLAETNLSKPPRLGSAELPSVGSLGHHMRRCRPCAFVLRMGCSNGTQCNFCHLCSAGEKKRRRKEKRALIGAARRLIVAESSATTQTQGPL